MNTLKKRKPGQPTKLLDENRRKIILDYIGKGNYIQTACLAADIHPATYCNWQRWAEEYEFNPNNGNENKKIYYEFFQELKKAEAKALADTINRIEDAGSKPQYWMANAWRAERKNPELWGRRDIPVIVESKILIAMQDNFARLKSPNLIEEKGVTRSDEGVTNEGD